jgi:hypothetical protein
MNVGTRREEGGRLGLLPSINLGSIPHDGFPFLVSICRHVNTIDCLCGYRLTLSGFHSFDLGAMPAVRPGFILKIVDVAPERTEPLGKPGVDVLMPKGVFAADLIHLHMQPQFCAESG